MSTVGTRAVGRGLARVEGVEKVCGSARYTGEIPLDGLVYGWVKPATIARGAVTAIDTAAVLARPGVIGVLTHENAPHLSPIDPADHPIDTAPLLQLGALLQGPDVHYYGQVIALVVAASLEQARAGAEALTVTYRQDPHDVTLRLDHPDTYAPKMVNGGNPADAAKGDVDAAIAAAAHSVDATYRTAPVHNNPMEPHVSTVTWDGDHLTAYDSNQGVTPVVQALAELFALAPGQIRIVSNHVGGGFGAKGTAAPPLVLATMAAKVYDRPVRVTLTRQQMVTITTYRTPTIQQIRLAADDAGRLVAVEHVSHSQVGRLSEHAEQAAVVSRVMYATPNLRSQHRLVPLDVPTPWTMRAPGEAPGMFALESAMDELAEACGVDPVELRIRNDADRSQDEGKAFSSRNLVACLRDGAARFGWHDRDPRPGVRADGRWLVGTGVAAATYPAGFPGAPPSTAAITARPDGTFDVEIAAADIGTGSRTALTQVAADALAVGVERVRVHLGDSDFGMATGAGGSLGTASWSWVLMKAGRDLRDRLAAGAAVPADGLRVEADTTDDVADISDVARHAFGAQFAEVRVDRDTGELRVPRLLGVFAAGHIINPITARSQFIGGMTWGLSMALHEETGLDPAFGDFVTHDLASYHFAAHADVQSIEAVWLDEDDDQLNPAGVKGIGEIGIVGTAAAIANAVWHATGHRHRELPLRMDRVLAGLPG